MALRVLLADESSTIKKVLQLALSDYGVEVKSVPSGIDVFSVAQDFKPDIVFADVLLTKKNGYEVCAELKSHSDFKNTPIILMWSGFMEFDEKSAIKANYSAKLEKPFDSEILRKLVNDHVPKTKNHPLEGLLEFGELPQEPSLKPIPKNTQTFTHEFTQKIPPIDFINEDPIADLPEIPDLDSLLSEEVVEFQQEGFPKPMIAKKSSSTSSSFSLPEIEEVSLDDDSLTYQEFTTQSSKEQANTQDLKIETPQKNPIEKQSNAEVHLPLTDDFVFNADDVIIETENFGDFEEVVLVKTDTKSNLAQPLTSHKDTNQSTKHKEIELNSKIQNKLNEYLEKSPLGAFNNNSSTNANSNAHSSLQSNAQVKGDNQKTNAYTEVLIREEARIMAEKICWQIIPEITEKIVREEIRKLLQDIEKSI